MFDELIQKRRSIRRFEERPVEPEKIDRLMEAALRAPSSRSLNPWEFIVVDERSKLETLAACKPHGAGFLAKAPLGVVICADPGKCDVWVEDCSIAITFIQLMAVSLDLGSCWIQVRKRAHVDGHPSRDEIVRHLNLPEHLEVEAMLAIGYPAETKTGHARSTLLVERLHRNAFGRPYPFSDQD